MASLTVLAGGIGLGYRWVTTATFVSKEQALRQFRQYDPATSNPKPPQTYDPVRSEQIQPGVLNNERPAEKPIARPILKPDPGVYTWRTAGYEEAMGIRRELPTTSHRIVSVEDGHTYRYKHIYSEEHEQWFEGEATQARVAVPHIRERVAFGPFDADIEVQFDPAMVFAKLPLTVDHAWTGRWSGDTYGSYAARVFERTTTRVAATHVEVWGVDLHIEMHGEIEGSQDLRAWLAPAERTTVREEYAVTGRLRGEPGSYHGEWTISLQSLTPQR